jgi:hypothetical protein
MLNVRKFALSTLDHDNIKYRDNFIVRSRGVNYRHERFTMYTLNDMCHRDRDLPAVEYDDRGKLYYQYGHLHRDNGPATITYCGGKIVEERYYIRGERIEHN